MNLCSSPSYYNMCVSASACKQMRGKRELSLFDRKFIIFMYKSPMYNRKLICNLQIIHASV